MNEREIFTATLEIADPAAREQFIIAACGDNPKLLERLRTLLQAHLESAEPLTQPVVEMSPLDLAAIGLGVDSTSTSQQRIGNSLPNPQSAREVVPQPGTMIGAYKLLEQIGEGGMGRVWMAEQQHPIRRQVAIKVIHAGLDSQSVLGRFEAERQALAMMDHINIAKVLDAGSTDDGRPYFVMELVKGIPITSYCDRNHLDVRRRLCLFADACRAVQHAHQKGIIHRDIKPANVMVAEYDGRPVAKVIDFGIAKAIHQPLTEKTLFTQFGQVVGTLEYMSPEQARLNQLDVDTRSDVYSLGVLLYELLTGNTPFDRKRFQEAAFDEILRMIREEEPPRPSDKLSTNATLPSIAANRGVESGRLTRILRGDLDWVVGKALDKDREQRYPSALDLASDIERYLGDQPVLAGPPTWSNRFRKFVRRNRKRILAGGLVILALMGGLVGTTWGLARAQHERDAKDLALQGEIKAREQAQAAENQARTALDTLTDEWVERQMAKQANLTEEDRKFLESIIAQYERYGSDFPDKRVALANKADGLRRVSMIRLRLGDMEQALESFGRTEAIQREMIASFPEQPRYRMYLGNTLSNQAIVLLQTNQRKEAEAKFREAVALLEQLTTEDPKEVQFRKFLASSRLNLGVLLKDLQRNPETIEEYLRAEKLLQQLVQEAPQSAELWEQLAGVQNNLGLEMRLANRPDESIRYFRKAIETLRRVVAIQPNESDYRTTFIRGLGNLGGLYVELENYTEALPLLRESVEEAARLSAEFPAVPEYLEIYGDFLSSLGGQLLALKQTDEGMQRLRKALDIRRQLASDFSKMENYRASFAEFLKDVAVQNLKLGQVQEAEEHLRQAMTQYEGMIKDFPETEEYPIQLLRVLGRLREMLKEDEAREEVLNRALEFLEATRKLGYFDIPEHLQLLRSDPDLAGLRKEPKFQDWEKQLSGP